MKRKIAILVTAAMTLSLAACGSNDDARQTAEPATSADMYEISETAPETSEAASEASEDITELSSELSTDTSEISAEVEVTVEETDEQEPAEGAPFVEDGRFWDEEEVLRLDLTGTYNGIEYGQAFVSIYTSAEEDSPLIGNIEVTDYEGNVVYSGELQQVMTNYYEIYGTSVNFTVYRDNDVLNLEMYVDGQHADYFVMIEHYES